MPDLEEWLELWRPDGSGDYFFGQKMEPGRKKKLEAAKARAAKTIFQNKLIEPEYAFLSRADMGVTHLVEQLEAVVNLSEIARRVEAGKT